MWTTLSECLTNILNNQSMYYLKGSTFSKTIKALEESLTLRKYMDSHLLCYEDTLSKHGLKGSKKKGTIRV